MTFSAMLAPFDQPCKKICPGATSHPAIADISTHPSASKGRTVRSFHVVAVRVIVTEPCETVPFVSRSRNCRAVTRDSRARPIAAPCRVPLGEGRGHYAGRAIVLCDERASLIDVG